MKGSRLGAAFRALVLIAGVTLLLYPTLSNLYNQIGASYAVQGYEDHSDEMTDEEREQLLADAEAYNAGLAASNQTLVAGEPHDPVYQALLNPLGTGMIGFLTIDKIGVQLPIYHGTSDDVLRTSVGHLEGSSLPVGGASTHAVISGHRGLPSATLFTDLDLMQEGDTFVITVLGRKMTYQVDSITVVEPDQLDELYVRPGEDRVTLLTCTPYGVNTQRLLVSGVRVPNGPEPVDKLDAPPVKPLAIILAVAAAALSVLLLVWFLRRRKKRRDEQMGLGRQAKHVRKDA